MTERAILHVMQTTHLGGTEHAALRAMQTLVGLGAGFRVTSPRAASGSWPAIVAIDPAARAFPCRGRGLFNRIDPHEFVRFRKHVRDLEARTAATWITGSSITALLACRERRRHTVLSNHSYHWSLMASPWRADAVPGSRGQTSRTMWWAFYETLCRHVDAITYPSEFTRAEAVRIAPWIDSRAVVVPNGYEVRYAGEAQRREQQRLARERLGLDPDIFIVGNAGWLNANKRFDVFLQTAARIMARRPESYFVICGGGPAEKALSRLAIELGVDRRLRFAGWIADMEPYYQALDVLLFNSDAEAMACTPMEAASHGCAVVASLQYGGLGEFLVDGRNGFFTDHHDPDWLADAVCELADNPTLAETFRRQAAADLALNYSLEKGAAFYRDFFGL
jgi:glycosyltransferase involved in cell wall biosynthesis